ncbi:hydantoinase B/oxoprolinase family protein [Mesorhizobium retamae]|uniref:Hydantoinase B/oxoprolinase family protein n=1 Tax=Mesorhizobium retamae TaxID=2912854 RepID=A0ABS9QD46_9HYPH|nr:hydantoinase B/oxoprolinase family protein [Mesorhizobium sp. IRAMC:0171]MCG7505344.1 hydantoinase B/oxoprolinase family protein [Mesorhizobium sp. IRAMC:0171]
MLATTDTKPISDIDLEIMWSRLISIADEAAIALKRTAFSTIVRESNDYAVVLLDENAANLAENSSAVPSFVGVLPRTLSSLLKITPPEEWHPGDCVVTNDPWLGTGHLPDLVVASPVYFKSKLIGFVASVAHLPDIGGTSLSATCHDVFEEGLRIPPMKLLDGGKANANLLDLIRANVRVADQVIPDIFAQISAHSVAQKGLCNFLAATGLSDLSRVSGALQAKSEAAMGRAIMELPDGEYRAVVKADGYGDRETEIHCCLRVDGANLSVDYSGTSPQVNFGINSVLNYTYSYTVYPLKCALDPETPHNEGSYKTIKVHAPEGSILNPVFPAPCNARHLTGQLLAGAIFECLAQAAPDRILAESGSAPSLRAMFSGARADGERFSQMLMCSGGMGASARGDGLSCMPFPTNTGAGSIEMFEGAAPLLIQRKELLASSGGQGCFRGGLGQEIEIEAVGKRPIQVSLMVERTKYPARGLQGGGNGSPAKAALGNGVSLDPKSRVELHPGETITLSFAGGGGFGNPAERSQALIASDKASGYTA